MYRAIRPLLFGVSRDPEVIHEQIIRLLSFVGSVGLLRVPLTQVYKVSDRRLSQTTFGIDFSSPVGLAAGFDKNARALQGLSALGFGFLEIGTITQHAQPGNPRQRIFRLPDDRALINRMGFNNDGAELVAKRLARGHLSIPLGISLGKSKITPLTEAVSDYLFSFKTLYPYGSYFAVNVSSPNTPGLRELQEKGALKELLRALQEANTRLGRGSRKPLLLKIAPDLTDEALHDLLQVVSDEKIDGLIATNTTISRAGLTHDPNETGGLSGKPLQTRALEVISFVHKELPQLPIIGVGGIFSPADALRAIQAGASLLQIYTGIIYEGPGLAKRIHRGLLEQMNQAGARNLQELQITKA